MNRFRRCVLIAGLSFSAPVLAGDDPYLRVHEAPDGSLALEIATRSFEPAEGGGATVDLVGVAHIGDASFYREMQRLLSEYDVVLYESVMPAGARAAGGDDDAERAATTEASMGFAASFVELHRAKNGRYPASLDEAATTARREDDRFGDWVLAAATDGWKRPTIYRSDPDGGMFVMASLGADAKRGGEGPDGDIVVTDSSDVATFAASRDGGIQQELASALGLAFQLEAMDYSFEHWQCSDMTIDQLERALAERGADMGPLGGALTGESLIAQFGTMALRALRIFDAMLDGVISDSIKVVLIETLGDESLVEQSMGQFDQGFGEVIIGDRNQVVIDDLEDLLEERPDVERIAIFYGAAHMADMAERLDEQLGYAAVDEQWLRAMEVDLSKSAMTAQDLRQMRSLLKRSMPGGF